MIGFWPRHGGQKWGTQVKRIFFALACCVAVIGPAWADVHDDLIAAIDKQDYETVRNLAQPLAENGDVEAQKVMGHLYYYGQGVPRDYNAAEKWFQKAADQGDKEAPAYLTSLKLVREDFEACKSFGLAEGSEGYEKCADDRSKMHGELVNLKNEVQQLTAQQQAAAKAAQAAAPKPKIGGVLGLIGALQGKNDYIPGTAGAPLPPGIGMPAAGPGATYGGQAQGPGFLRSQQRSGFNKICTYDRMGSAYVITVGAAELCPQTIN